MASYVLQCTCGHTETLEAGTRDQAIEMFRAGMTQEALDQHFAQYHKQTEQKPTLEQTHAMISQMVAAA